MTGKRRCRAHGGATPKGRHSGPIRHGIYSKKLTEEEKALWPTIKVGSLDDEIRIAQIILHRLIETHEAIQAAPLDPKNAAGFYAVEVTITTLDGKTVTMKVPDTYALIDRFLGRIARLKLTRARLLAAKTACGDERARRRRRVDAAALGGLDGVRKPARESLIRPGNC
jgi:hypothetical protein